MLLLHLLLQLDHKVQPKALLTRSRLQCLLQSLRLHKDGNDGLLNKLLDVIFVSIDDFAFCPDQCPICLSKLHHPNDIRTYPTFHLKHLCPNKTYKRTRRCNMRCICTMRDQCSGQLAVLYPNTVTAHVSS
jgi:hypothetical protein